MGAGHGRRVNNKISKQQLHEKIRDIGDQFRPDALPIDYFDATPDISQKSDLSRRLFVRQLTEIALQNQRIEKAILDYYRAYQQRSRWVREDLLFGEELETYEQRLIDEWQRHFLALSQSEDVDKMGEEELKNLGREIFNWADFNADENIRPLVTERYVLRGSYHILANMHPPQVWWHPLFLKRLEEVIPNTDQVRS